jgi:hypothetical protein
MEHLSHQSKMYYSGQKSPHFSCHFTKIVCCLIFGVIMIDVCKFHFKTILKIAKFTLEMYCGLHFQFRRLITTREIHRVIYNKLYFGEVFITLQIFLKRNNFSCQYVSFLHLTDVRIREVESIIFGWRAKRLY